MIIGLALIIFVAFATEAMAGFGSVMISLAVGTLFWPISELLPVVVPTSLALSSYMVSRYWRFIDRRLFIVVILPLMGLGLGVGQYLVPYVSEEALRIMLGVIVMGAAIRGLLAMARQGHAPAENKRERPLWGLIWIGGAGIVHGMIATGGPPLVYALESIGLDKKQFRSTLAAVWFSLNLILTIRFASAGTLGGEQFRTIGILVPVVALALLLGEFLHHYVSEKVFRGVVFSLLTLAGVLLWLPVMLG